MWNILQRFICPYIHAINYWLLIYSLCLSLCISPKRPVNDKIICHILHICQTFWLSAVFTIFFNKIKLYCTNYHIFHQTNQLFIWIHVFSGWYICMFLTYFEDVFHRNAPTFPCIRRWRLLEFYANILENTRIPRGHHQIIGKTNNLFFLLMSNMYITKMTIKFIISTMLRNNKNIPPHCKLSLKCAIARSHNWLPLYCRKQTSNSLIYFI